MFSKFIITSKKIRTCVFRWLCATASVRVQVRACVKNSEVIVAQIVFTMLWNQVWKSCARYGYNASRSHFDMFTMFNCFMLCTGVLSLYHSIFFVVFSFGVLFEVRKESRVSGFSRTQKVARSCHTRFPWTCTTPSVPTEDAVTHTTSSPKMTGW